MNLLVLIKDLVLSTQIRTSCEAASINYSSSRTYEKFAESLEKLKPEKIIIDLNISSTDPFEAIEKAKLHLNPRDILCFYSHVNTELAQKAIEAGLFADRILKRSIFFNSLAELSNNKFN